MITAVLREEQPDVVTVSVYSWKHRFISDVGGESLTEQHHKDDCDIHTILRRFVATGVLPVLDSSPVYGDFSNVQSYQEAQNLIARINEYFKSLPSRFRERFGNDISKFIDFVNDPSNRKECQELGLIEKDSAYFRSVGLAPGVADLSGDNSSAKEVVQSHSEDDTKDK